MLSRNRGFPIYTSEFLEELWPYGAHSYGELTFESAAYVARYVTKKYVGKHHLEYYGHREPEKACLQPRGKKGGLGKPWLDLYKSDVYPHDEVMIKRGDKCISMKPPKYYDRRFEIAEPEKFLTIKKARKEAALEKHPFIRLYENSRQRLRVKATIMEAKFKLLKRGYENET